MFSLISANVHWQLTMFQHWSGLAAIRQNVQGPNPRPLPPIFLLAMNEKKTTYNGINMYIIKHLAKMRLWGKKSDPQVENGWETFMEHRPWCITISWHSLEWFIDVYHLHSDITLTMLAMLLSIFMDLALRGKLVPTDCSKQGFMSAGPVSVAGFPSLTSCSILENKMSHPFPRPCATSAPWECSPFITCWQQPQQAGPISTFSHGLLCGCLVEVSLSWQRSSHWGPAVIHAPPGCSRAELYTQLRLRRQLLSWEAEQG